MKKLILCALIICLLCCSGCLESEPIESKAERGAICYVDFTDEIVADKDTHILYYRYSRDYGVVLSPYYSKNGKLCRYEDGKIIEVEN
jgi:hypothetical protein